MKHLEVNKVTKETRKNKGEIKKELEDSLIIDENDENKVEKCENAAALIREFEIIIKS